MTGNWLCPDIVISKLSFLFERLWLQTVRVGGSWWRHQASFPTLEVGVKVEKCLAN